jgi:hypothetical protein
MKANAISVILCLGAALFLAVVSRSEHKQLVRHAIPEVPRSTSPPLSYLARTDQNEHLQFLGRHGDSLPNVGGLVGAGAKVTDPDFGSTIYRVTDYRTTCSGKRIYFPVFGAERGWAADSSAFLVDAMYGVSCVMYWDGTTGKATLAPYTLSPTSVYIFSHSDPNVLWERAGTTINQIVLNRSTGTLSRTKLFDFVNDSQHCLPSGFKARSAGLFMPSQDDTSFSLLYSQGQQDTGHDIVNYTVGQGCRHYDTETGVIDGDWGEIGQVSTTARFLVHEAVNTPNPVVAAVGPTDCLGTQPCDRSSPFLWNVPTTNVVECTDGCAGHGAYGFISRYASATFVQHYYSNPAQPLVEMNPPGLPPSVDQHPSWNNNDGTDGPPFLVAAQHASSGSSPMKVPFSAAHYNEIIGVTTDGSHTVYRFAHTFATGWASQYETAYAMVNVSPDGRWAAWTSDWMRTLGCSNGARTHCSSRPNKLIRSDIFIVDLQSAH